MDVVEFAERVVFSTNLEAKLSPPSDVDAFEQRQVSRLLSEPAIPGRPVDLRIDSDSSAATVPSIADLEKSENRGKLLHFLANHELLATELMALVLLKFPEAPEAFRRGVLETLVEEQRHTRMYLRRMVECGVEFGSFPLSGHFWRVVAPMRNPMDFVSKLSLTFEQANLDYSLYFANVFQQIGDAKTARKT